MKKINSVILLICFMFASQVVNAESAGNWINRVKWIDEGEKAITKEETVAYLDEAFIHIQKGVNNPMFYYFRGRLTSILQGHYIRSLLKAGKKYRLDAPENQALIKKYESYYRKALELDDNPSAPDHLTVDMLANISDDVLADPDIKAKALQKEMELSQSGGYVSENPNYIWETYEVMLENYIQQQDYDNYLKTVNEMIERFPQSSQMDSLLEAKQQALEAIAQRDRIAATQGAYAQVDTYVYPKAAAVQKPVKAVEPKKAGAPKATNEKHLHRITTPCCGGCLEVVWCCLV